jgi:hypothetical protein
VIFGQEGALRDAIERGGGSWGISTRAFVFHFKGATVHRRRLSLWSNEPPEKGQDTVIEGEQATGIVRCRLKRVRLSDAWYDGLQRVLYNKARDHS